MERKICIRSGQHIYNNALMRRYIAKHGEAKAEQWLQRPEDKSGAEPVRAATVKGARRRRGQVRFGIANTYYWALMLNSDPDKKAWAQATKVILASFKDAGTHVNLRASSSPSTRPTRRTR